MKTLFTFVVLALASFAFAGEKKCRALIMEGGGPRNAYSAGVLKAIINNLKEEDYRYDVVSGVSMAAINTFILGMHEPGDELDAVTEIFDFWENLEESMVYKAWSGGYIEGFLFKSGLYNSEPLEETFKNLRKNYKHGFLRNFSITLTDLNSGILFITN